jgi:beta-glucosidase
VQATVRLVAGRAVPIQVEYSSKAALFGQQIHLAWQTPSQSLIAGAVDAAKRSDVAIVFANNAQGEGMDRTSLGLPGDQDQLIQAVADANKRTIVVLNNGGPVLMPWLRDVDAVLETWYPGQQFGTAIAGVLFGDADPGGRLPVTFPANDEQGPAPPTRPERYPGVNGDQSYDEGLLVGYRWYDERGQRPLFPFGYGLSYADFRFSDLDVRYDRRGGVATASLRVRNVSRRTGSTVAQLYLEFPRQADEPRQLKGYEKVTLRPDESTRVSFRLGDDELSYFDEGSGKFVVAPGEYRVLVGTSSRDFGEREDFEVRR